MKTEDRHYVAKEGMVFTKGSVFVKELWLGTGDTLDNWEEITDAEAKKIQDEMAAKAHLGV